MEDNQRLHHLLPFPALWQGLKDPETNGKLLRNALSFSVFGHPNRDSWAYSVLGVFFMWVLLANWTIGISAGR